MTTAATTRIEMRRRRRQEKRRKYKPQAAVVGLIVAALAISGLYPAQQLLAKRKRIAGLEAESARLDREIAELRTTRDALQTDAEVERLARKDLGMVRPGEQAFAVVPGQSPVPERVFQPPVPGEETRSALSRWWGAFTDALRILR